MLSAFGLVAALLLLPHGTSAAVAEGGSLEPAEAKIVMTPAPPKIDGAIGDGEWEGAVKVQLGYQIQPGDNAPASERTEVYLTYDREHLYVAFRAFDSTPQSLRARVTRRDDVFNDDYVALYLDTYNDKQRAYAFYFNPLGIQADGLYAERQSGLATTSFEQASDLSFDAILESKGAVTADGYVVEVALPFKSLRFKTEGGWGLHVHRWIARRAELTSWRPLRRDTSGLLIQEGSLTGLADVFAGRTLDIIPTITASLNGEREPAALPGADARLNNVRKMDPGLTINWALAPNVVFSAAVNPDFSQVEADVPQLQVNQRFPLFFPEKRPFFLEGTEIFQPAQSSASSLNLVDTRRIVDPDWGVKLTAKAGRYSIGILSASDRAPGLLLAPTDEDFGSNAYYNVARVKRDVLKDSAVGFTLTDRRFAGSANTALGGDGVVRFGRSNVFAFQVVGTRSSDADGTKRHGAASFLRHTYDGRRWKTTLLDTRISKDYEALTGFTRRTGYQRQFARVIYDYRQEGESKRWYVAIRPFVVGALLRTSEGLLDETYIDQGVEFILPRGISFSLLNSFDRESFVGRELSYQYYGGSFSIERFKRVAFSGSVYLGGGLNFVPDNFVGGRRRDASFDVTFKPSNRLNSELNFTRSGLVEQRTGRRLFNEDIWRNRTVFQFTRFSAVRSILEYDTAFRRAGVSLLYSYTPSPNTALYVGYSDLLFNGLDPLEDRRSPGVFRLRRTFFTKLSYNFRL